MYTRASRIRTIALAIAIIFSILHAFAQAGEANQLLPEYQLSLEESTIPGLPGLQSFAWAQHQSRWLLIGGRKDGLHRRQPFATFQPEGANDRLFVVDPATGKVWSADLKGLPVSIAEQLGSTNIQFYQDGNTLYLLGGYGFSWSREAFVSYPSLTAVDVPGLMDAIVNGKQTASFFRQTEDERMAVTGGALGKIGDRFYLAGGHRFDGAYNPTGPTTGPGFSQEYTNGVRSFRIQNTGEKPILEAYEAWTDSLEWHRRDYNLVPQIFPDKTEGYTAFSGVFQYDVNLPWLNTVDINANGYKAKPGFEQLLNCYHSANLPLYDAATGVMQTVFFGGISQFYFDETNTLLNDYDVPFTQAISAITRTKEGRMTEALLPAAMPDYLGAAAWFLPATEAPFFANGVLDFLRLPQSKTLVGYVVGGIESDGGNIFWVNTGTQSRSSSRVFKVFIEKKQPNPAPLTIDGNAWFQLAATPAPRENWIRVQFNTVKLEELLLELFNEEGELVGTLVEGTLAPGQHVFDYSISFFTPGNYTLRLTNGQYRASVPVERR
jgi:hypothetical protein